MALQNGDMSSEQLLRGQAHVWSHTLAYVNSMSLKCAIQLGIPDVIYKHGKPISLYQLVEAISVDNAKSHHIDRLMRILVHSKIFIKDLDQEEARYWLTPASRLLLRKPPLTLVPLTLLMLDPIVTKTWHHMSEWLTTEGHITQFEVAHDHESTFWEHAATKPSMGSLFNEAMCGDSSLVAEVLVRNYKHVFVGVKSLVDDGGGTGTMGKAIIDALPDIKCIVLDLPHVVAGLESTDKLSYVGGDMFETIPVPMLFFLRYVQWIMHNWNDDECLKILKRCKDAVTDNGTRGKVMIIDVVVDVNKEDNEVVGAQLYFDMAMMSYFNAKERSEKEWAKLFSDAGFTSYTITPAFGVHMLNFVLMHQT